MPAKARCVWNKSEPNTILMSVYRPTGLGCVVLQSLVQCCVADCTARSPLCLPQVVDRPTQGHKFLSRQYIQPQWVFDSANFRVLAKAELYAVGLVPPPHLSPFTQADDEGYVPDYMKTMLQLQVLCSDALFLFWYQANDEGYVPDYMKSMLQLQVLC